MQTSKRFFYVSLGILALALSFHLGAKSAQSRGETDGTARIVALDARNEPFTVVAPDGYVYVWNASTKTGVLLGNVYSGAATTQPGGAK